MTARVTLPDRDSRASRVRIHVGAVARPIVEDHGGGRPAPTMFVRPAFGTHTRGPTVHRRWLTCRT